MLLSIAAHRTLRIQQTADRKTKNDLTEILGLTNGMQIRFQTVHPTTQIFVVVTNAGGAVNLVPAFAITHTKPRLHPKIIPSHKSPYARLKQLTYSNIKNPLPTANQCR